MMRSHGSSGPLQALYKVFVVPSLQRGPRPARHFSAAARQLARPSAARHTYTSPAAITRHFQTSAAALAKSRPPETRSQAWNEEIPARRVRIVDVPTNTISEPQWRDDVLRSLDHKTYRLVSVETRPEEVDGEWIPLCKIMDKKTQYQIEKAKEKQRKNSKKVGSDTVKTLELNWAIDRNDLGHRLDRVTEFLNEGRRVEIVLAVKKRGRVATADECQDVLKRIRDTVEGVKGAKVAKELEGKIGAMATMFLEGPKQ